MPVVTLAGMGQVEILSARGGTTGANRPKKCGDPERSTQARTDLCKTSHGGVKVVGPLLTGEHYGIAINKQKPELVETIDDGLAKIKESGEHDQLFVTCFGGDMSGAVESVENLRTSRSRISVCG